MLVRKGELALGHCEMVRLVMRAANQQPNETKATDVLHFFGIGRSHSQKDAIGQRRGFGAPAVEVVDFPGLRGDHPLNGNEGTVAARDGYFEAAIDRLGDGIGFQRHLVHVDQVLAQPPEVDLRPIGFWVGVENSHDFPYRAKRVLTDHSRSAQTRGHDERQGAETE